MLLYAFCGGLAWRKNWTINTERQPIIRKQKCGILTVRYSGAPRHRRRRERGAVGVEWVSNGNVSQWYLSPPVD